jgi:hypothetical protein
MSNKCTESLPNTQADLEIYFSVQPDVSVAILSS